MISNPRTPDRTYDLEKTDGNVDENQAHELYKASKQRIKSPAQDLANPKPLTQMKRISKH